MADPARRDRRDDGRPEQSRPRDRTGRPLPYGSTGVPLTEEHEPASVEEALVLGLELWRDQRLFEAHECLEHVWHAAPDPDRDLWQGFIQVAVAGVHLQRDNPDGAAATFAKAERRLAAYPDEHRGLDVAGLRATCATGREALSRGQTPPLPAPSVTASGPWFAPRSDATGPGGPTPVSERPAWRQPPRGTAPRDEPPPTR